MTAQGSGRTAEKIPAPQEMPEEIPEENPEEYTDSEADE